MSKSRRRLTIPVEVFNREFDAKVLLSCFAAERGFSVILGEKHEIKLNLASLPRSIFIPTNLHPRNQVTNTLLNNLGHTLVGSDEEAIVYCSPEVYVKEKLGTEVFPQPKLFFAWGPENSRIWKMQHNYNEMPIHITGNPRTDLLRPELRPYWSDQVESIRKRFGRIILINTNFGKLNHFRPNKGDERKALDMAALSPSKVDESELGMAKHRLTLFQFFQEMVGKVAEAFPNHTVLIRPHPSESHESWIQAAKGCANVQVHIEGHVIPWLLAADSIIHNSCTTGLEGYLLGRPVFSYQPITSERFDKKLPNTLSHKATSCEELIQLIKTSLVSAPIAEKSAAQEKKQLIEDFIAALQGPFACERIVSALEKFEDTCLQLPPNWKTVMVAKTHALSRKLRRKFNATFRLGDQNRARRYEYLKHIFPEIDLYQIERRINSFQNALSRFNNIGVKALSNSIFEISSN
jgi:surface carbohydrate biosynthesis protein